MRIGRRPPQGPRGRRRVAVAAFVVTAALTLPAVTAPAPTAGDALDVRRLAGLDRITTAVAVSEATFASAPAVVLAGSFAAPDALAGAPFATHLGGPLLLTQQAALHPETRAEVRRLGATQVTIVGGETAVGPAVVTAMEADGLQVHRIGGADRYETAVAIARAMPPTGSVVIGIGDDLGGSVVAAAFAAATDQPLLLTDADAPPPALTDFLRRGDPASGLVIVHRPPGDARSTSRLADLLTSVEELADADLPALSTRARDRLLSTGNASPASAWLAGSASGGLTDALAAAPAVGASGSALLLVDGEHLERAAAPARALRAGAADLRQVTLLGGPVAVTADADRQLFAVVHGPGLPGTGSRRLEDHLLVGAFGYHNAPELGVLGEQPATHAPARVESLIAPYRSLSDRPVLPVYDLVATLATAEAGRDGLHRRRTVDSDLLPYLQAARSHGGVLVLDIQPARSDWLTEVAAYHHLLVEPDIGIGMDVEWAVGPTGTPGRGFVGMTTAAEISAVARYLGSIVTAHGLPEKLLIVHIFKDGQIPDIHAVDAVDGVRVVFEVDGIGTPDQKRATYTRLAQPLPHANGFMIFLKQDPELIAPEAAVLLAHPLPELILYQ